MIVDLRISCQGTFVRGVGLAAFSLLAQGTFAVTVNCGDGETISSALTPGAVIEIIGPCRENVVITHDDVTLVRATGQPKPKLRSKSKTNKSAIVIDGARRVKLSNLLILNSLNGVVATNGATFTLRKSTVRNNQDHGVVISDNASGEINDSVVKSNGLAGVSVARSALVILQLNTIRLNDEYGVLLVDGANAQIRAGNTIEEGSIAAIGAFRGISLRVLGDNVIGKEAGDGVSLSLFHSVDFRQDVGHTMFNGSMEFGNLTNASLRDPEIRDASTIDVSGGSHLDIRESSNESDELTGESDITVSSNSRLTFNRDIIVNVMSIDVRGFSSLNLRNNVSVTTIGDVFMNGSLLPMAPGSSMNVGGNFTAVDGADIRIFGNDASLNVAGDFSAEDRADISIFGDDASLNAANDFGAVNRVDIFIPGDGASLNVGGNVAADRFFSMSLGNNVSLNFGFMGMSTFAVLSGNNDVSITGDVDFGPNVGNVFFEDNFSYTGAMSFGEASDLTFGSGAEITGTIDCNGGNVHVVTMPNFISGGFVNCTVLFL